MAISSGTLRYNADILEQQTIQLNAHIVLGSTSFVPILFTTNGYTPDRCVYKAAEFKSVSMEQSRVEFSLNESACTPESLTKEHHLTNFNDDVRPVPIRLYMHQRAKRN